MRRKIAKRRRKEILRRGATIVKEGWFYLDGSKKREDRGFEVVVECNGWKIFSADDNELDAYGMALDCVKYDCETSYEEEKKKWEAEQTDGANDE